MLQRFPESRDARIDEQRHQKEIEESAAQDEDEVIEARLQNWLGLAMEELISKCWGLIRKQEGSKIETQRSRYGLIIHRVILAKRKHGLDALRRFL